MNLSCHLPGLPRRREESTLSGHKHPFRALFEGYKRPRGDRNLAPVARIKSEKVPLLSFLWSHLN
jgi:hypothetical protein